ncbi:hypothetical protein LINPERHAP1_LOCUS6100 [Linum perenne]
MKVVDSSCSGGFTVTIFKDECLQPHLRSLGDIVRSDEFCSKYVLMREKIYNEEVYAVFYKDSSKFSLYPKDDGFAPYQSNAQFRSVGEDDSETISGLRAWFVNFTCSADWYCSMKVVDSSCSGGFSVTIFKDECLQPHLRSLDDIVRFRRVLIYNEEVYAVFYKDSSKFSLYPKDDGFTPYQSNAQFRSVGEDDSETISGLRAWFVNFTCSADWFCSMKVVDSSCPGGFSVTIFKDEYLQPHLRSLNDIVRFRRVLVKIYNEEVYAVFYKDSSKFSLNPNDDGFTPYQSNAQFRSVGEDDSETIAGLRAWFVNFTCSADWFCSMKVVDSSCPGGFSVTNFKDEFLQPHLRSLGDIVRFRRVLVKIYNEEVYAVFYKDSSKFSLYPKDDGFTPY